MVERGALRNMVCVVATCDCGDVITATSFQVNLKAHCIEYMVKVPYRHQDHTITYTKDGLITWL